MSAISKRLCQNLTWLRRKLCRRCGTKHVLLCMFLLTLLVNLQLRLVSVSDYTSITFRLDDYTGPCVLPVLDPFDATMLRDYKDLTPFQCQGPPRLVYFDVDGTLVFNQSTLTSNGWNSRDIVCECQHFVRVDGDNWVEFSKPFTCEIPFSYTKDFLKVTCKHKLETVYRNLLFKTHRRKQYGKTGDGQYSVILFGIDTVSRSSSIRHMRKSVKYLKEELGAYDFKGYMKIGAVTYPNLVAVLSGLFPSGRNELPIKDENHEFFDDMPFIWRNFSVKNYTTFYAEDLPLLNSFNLKKRGFKEQPVDHYLRPYWLGWHKEIPMRDYKNGISLDLLNVGLLKGSLEQYLCTGDITNYAAQINYLKDFITTYEHERKFGLSFLVEIAHNNQNILNLADRDIFEFFVWMKSKGHLEDTILIVFSDHGPKTGHALYTSRMEKSLPMLYIVLPEKLKTAYPTIAENFSENTKKLTTHFDLHATLRDILDRRYASPTTFRHNGKVRGRSLFGPIPSNRSCAEAHVAEHFCVCYKSHSIPVEGNKAIDDMGRTVVNRINSMLASKPNCVQLTLNKIIQVDQIVDAQSATYTRNSINVLRPKLQTDNREKFIVVIETSPSGAQFLATCIRRPNQPIEVLEEIDRLNRYNNQSHCVEETHLRPLCYCKVQ